MTRLEEIEARIDQIRVRHINAEHPISIQLNHMREHIVALDEAVFALDCYKARVAVLEEALRLVKYDLENCEWQCVSCGVDPAMEETDIYTAFILPVIDLSPEECLARQVGEEG